tara:strand:+ start:744 stop:1208 length:465 start_codon:yes stop_codon:yes gene_type:complete
MQAGALRKAENESNTTNLEEKNTPNEQLKELVERIQNLESEVQILTKRVNELENSSHKTESLIKVEKEKDHPKQCIIIENYRKSIIVKNQYSDKFTTIPYKEKYKELGGKWTKNDKITGWLFVGKNTESSLEKSAQFIIEEFDGDNFEYTINEI